MTAHARGEHDERWMTRALVHAWAAGRYGARPNPMVGAVLARGGDLLASGAHARWGDAHAERACLDTWTGPIPEDATLYVTLEPCSHHGRQPPCSQLLIDRGVRRVVIGCVDPNPQTRGEGPRQLEDAGIEVAWIGPRLAQRAVDLNRGFQRVHRDGRPEMIAKFAITRNGRFATGDPQRRWISSLPARAEVQQMRAVAGAVLVGVGTVIADDPLLNVRDVELPDHARPVRVILDRHLRTPPGSQLFDAAGGGPVLVIATEPVSGRRRRELEQRGAEVHTAPAGDEYLPAVMQLLASRCIHDVLVEAGPTLIEALWDQQLIDRVRCYRASFDGAVTELGLHTEHPLFERTTVTRSVGTDEVLEADLHPLLPLAPGS